MSFDPNTAHGELDDLTSLAATDAWLDAVSQGESLPDDQLAEAMNSWLTALSADHTAAAAPASTQTLPSAVRSSARGAVAVAVAAALFVGAGTAAALPASPIHRVIFGNTTVRHVPSAPDYRPAELALARAAQAVSPLLPGGVVTAAQRAEALRLIDAAAAAIAVLPLDATRAGLDAQRAALLRDLTRLRVLGAVAGSVETTAPGAPTQPAPVSTGGTARPPAVAAPTASHLAPNSNGGAGSSDPSTPAPPSTPPTPANTDQDSSTSTPQPTDPSNQDTTTSAGEAG